MKYLICSFLMCMTLTMFGQDRVKNLAVTEKVSAEDGIQWMTWSEAVEANKKEPKKIFVDIYTEW